MRERGMAWAAAEVGVGECNETQHSALHLHVIPHHPVISPPPSSFAPDATASQLGIQGILVLECERGGPADRAGIRGTSRDPYGRLRRVGYKH